MAMIRKNSELISLKEAAKISGYSPDYIGQLIRSGKLPGKQVFSHVAWMTTEEDVRAYMGKKNGVPSESSSASFVESLKKKVTTLLKHQMEVPRLLNKMLYVAIGISLIFLLFLFYILAASIEHHLDQRAIENAEVRTNL